MVLRIRFVYREFSPAEAAAITSVSTDLQRDWRRRALLPETRQGKWTRFDLKAVIRMAVMKTFADAGFSVSYVAQVADSAILPTFRFLFRMPDALTFEGVEIDADQQAEIIGRPVVGGDGRFLVMLNDEAGQPLAFRVRFIEDAEDVMARHGAINCSLLDCLGLARTIAQRAGGPVIRIEVERGEDDEPA